MQRKDFSSFLKIVEKFRSFLLACHENPDGDAIGSMLALGIAFKERKKEITYYSPEKIPQNLGFLPESEKIQNKLSERQFDVVVALDAGEKKRLKLPWNNLHYQYLVNIDHHPQKKPFGTLNLLKENTSSTAEIVYYILKKLGLLNYETATCLLTGIFADTGGFQHANTRPQTLEIAAELMKKGANLNRIAREVDQNKSLAALKIWGRALARTLQDKKKGVTLSAITKKDFKELGARPEDLEGVVSIINTAEGTRYALLLSEQDKNRIKASLRSEEGRGVDVSKIAQRYGGGGHPLASGFTIKGRLARKKGKWVIQK